MKKWFVFGMLCMSLSAVAAPIMPLRLEVIMDNDLPHHKVTQICTYAAAPMTAAHGYTVTAGVLIDAYYGSEATITYVGVTTDNEPMWDVKFGGITLCIIETI